jgi:hypothetical protein
MKKLILFLFCLFPMQSQATEEFVLNDVNCQVKINTVHDRLFDLFQELLKQKGYEPIVLTAGQSINRGELTARFEKKHLDGKWYKDCQINLKLMRLTSHQSEHEAEMVVDHTTVRSLPRITFKGHERCSRGLRDAFIHLPPCKKP